jgi:mono/diheme cytochrome c family protein
MSRLPRILALVSGTLAGIFAALLVIVYVLSARALNRKYVLPAFSVTVPADSAAVARGAHLVQIGTCATCHGSDLGGRVYADMGPVGVVAGPNLTRGRGGRGGFFTDEDWVRAIRFGIRANGTSLIMMPSEVFMNFSDDDLGAMIAYLKQVQPIDREMPTTRFGILGRALLAAGRLKILTAPKTPAKPAVAAVPIDDSAPYGKYLVEASGCAGCHGYGLSGGRVAGPPGLPPASNLTPAGIGTWVEDDLRRVLREGRKPDGSPVNPFMPLDSYGQMTDEEISAIWRYLRSVPPKPFGNK